MKLSTQWRPALPVMIVPAIVVLLLTLMTLGLRVFHGDAKVPVLAHDIAAGTEISGTDFAAKPKSFSGFGGGEALDKRTQIVGHVATERITAGTAIGSAQLTKQAVASSYTHEMTLRFRAEDATTVEVDSGDRVRLMFAPANDAESARAEIVPATLIDATKDGATTTFFVAIESDEARNLLELVGRSRLIVVKA
jgi:hypothetical protein